MPQEKIIIKFSAKGDKALINAIKQLDIATKRLQGKTSLYEKELKALGLQQKKFNNNTALGTRNNRLLANSFATIRSKLLLVSFAMSMGVRQLIEFTKEAAKIESMAMAFHTLSGGSQNAAGAMEALRNATNGTMSEFDLFQQANNAMILGVSKNSDEMAEMFDIAQRLGRALGRDTRSSVESLITGIGRQSRLMLDNIGIIVKAEEAYESYADKLGKTVDTLSDSEKKTAFLQATMASAREKVGRLGDETLTTTDSFDRFGASVSEIARRIGDELKPATSSLMDLFSDWVDSTREITFEQAYNTKSLEVLQNFIKQTRGEIHLLRSANSQSTASFKDLRFASQNVKDEIQRLEQIIISAQPHLIELGIAAEEFGDVCEEATGQVNLFDETVGDSIPSLLFVNELYAKSKEVQLELVEARIAVLESFIAMHGATNEEAVALQVLIDLHDKLTGKSKEEASAKKEQQKQQDKLNRLLDKEKEIRLSVLESAIKYGIESKSAGQAAEAAARGVIEKWIQKAVAIQFEKALEFIPLPPPFNLAIAAAMAAAASSKISSELSAIKFEQGGLIGGRRHSQGGTMIEAEQGEFVMSRSAVDSVGIENLNRMNEGGGGGAVTVNVSGNVLTEDFVSGELAENIKEAIRRGTDFGIS